MQKKVMTKAEILEQMHELCRALTPEETELFVENMTIHTFRKNELIYRAGDMPNVMMCLLAGKVKVVREGVSGRQQIVRVRKPASYFGYRASFAGQHFRTSAIAIEQSVVGMIPMRIITEVMRQSHRLCWFFIRQLSLSLGDADERTVNLTQKHIRGRLAEALLFLKDSYGLEEDGSTLSIYLSREDLANLSNMTTSNAIRTLSGFAHEKLIAVDGRKIKFINEEEIRNISKLG